TFYGLTDDRTNQDVAMGSLRIDHKFSDALDFKNQLQYNWYRTDAQETAPNNLVGVDGTVIDRTKGNYTNLPLDDQADLTAKFTTGSIAHTLLTGIELAHDTYKNQAYSRTGLPLVPLID